MTRFRKLWSNLRSSFWFLPSLIVVVSITLAVALIDIDSAGSDQELTQWSRLFGAGAEGARGMMPTIAGSMMTVVGVTFSMVLMVLAIASSQYTSRILRNFIRSRATLVVLGSFAGIFTYCLIVSRTIRSGVGALIFFIHHIATSIQASSIIASVAEETITAFARLFPVNLGQGPGDDEHEQPLSPPSERKWRAVMAGESGYIQSVDSEALVRVARDGKTIVWMDHGIGEFVVQNTTLASLALREPPDQATTDALHGAFNISRHRTVDQDAAIGIRQIVDIALKALSPGINDTTTAIMCVDYLTANPYRRHAISEEVQRIAELTERTVEALHGRARIDRRLTRVREALEARPALCTGDG